METLKIERYTADELFNLWHYVADDGDLSKMSTEKLELVGKVQAVLDRITTHKTDSMDQLCKTLGISQEGKSNERIACEIAAFRGGE